ncbi:DUF222 domain-containing protein [Arthrobacter sp. JCM 19049]|uniref:DUF222 domain-containing protein n=1 Tax=Arthrobacter sp. JCM 19049 TaxID=1460643 RepID=UPI002436F489|nr:DUF222 domain-containing protein [Arthrobacter sp. JCM 19049]
MPEGCLHDEVAELIEQLTRRVDILLRAGERGDCAEALRQLESAKASYCAMQAKLAYRLEKDTILDAEDRCINIDQFERGAAASVAMARRQSQQGARSYLQACRMLVEDLPNLCASFERGHLSERQILAITGPLTDVNAAVVGNSMSFLPANRTCSRTWAPSGAATRSNASLCAMRASRRPTGSARPRRNAT